MDYEQKYKEALERAKEIIECSKSDTKEVRMVLSFFPELKKSEGERMVKFIKKQLFNIKKTITDNYKLDTELTNAIDWLDKQGEQKPVENVEPKFKVRYAGREYNVLEIKELAGITFYGIEDEPNHIDYIKAENCEIIGGYVIKENGSLYPTKPAMFSGQKASWSEDDKEKIESVLGWLDTLKNYIHYDQFVSLDIRRERFEQVCRLEEWLKKFKSYE